MISFPSSLLPNDFSSQFIPFIVEADRVNLSIWVTSSFGTMLMLEVIYRQLVEKSIHFFLSVSLVIIFCLIIMLNSYEGLSLLSAILDLGQIICCLAIFFYFRLSAYLDTFKALNLFNSVFFLMFILVFIDILITLSGLVPWSTSYRGGLQGIFHAHELAFSFVVGISFSVILSRINLFSLSYSAIFCFGLIILIATNIKTAAAAFIIINLIIPVVRSTFLKKIMPFFFFLFFVLGILVASNAEEANTITSRLGTIFAYLVILPTDGNWIFGIKPGVFDFTMKSNLAVHVFQMDFMSSLLGLNEVFIQEIAERDSYSDGSGFFLPHNSGLVLISAYGIFALPAIYYFYYYPIKIILKLGRSQTYHYFLGAPIIFIFLFSLFHPFIALIPLILLVEVGKKIYVDV